MNYPIWWIDPETTGARRFRFMLDMCCGFPKTTLSYVELAAATGNSRNYWNRRLLSGPFVLSARDTAVLAQISGMPHADLQSLNDSAKQLDTARS